MEHIRAREQRVHDLFIMSRPAVVFLSVQILALVLAWRAHKALIRYQLPVVRINFKAPQENCFKVPRFFYSWRRWNDCPTSRMQPIESSIALACRSPPGCWEVSVANGVVAKGR